MADLTKEQLIEEIKYLKKQISEKSSENEYRLKTLFNAMKDIVFEMDYDGRYLNIAPTSPNLMYKLPEDAVGKTLHEVFLKEDADIFLEFIRNTISNNITNTIEYPLVIDGKTIWFEGTATPKTKNTVLYIARDITKSKLASEKLLHSYKTIEQERNIFTEGSVVVFKWAKGDNWPVEYVSQNVKNIFGFTADEFINGKVSYKNLVFNEDLDNVSKEISDSLKRGVSSFSHNPYRITRKDGKIIWVDDNTTIIRNNAGEITHYFGYVVDITQRKNAEERLIATNQQFEANNQQLISGEQQLRASNQQLEATNQQLRASEQAIKESEDKYKKLFEHAPIGIATIGIDGYPISMNQHILNILGSPSLEASKQINVITFSNLVDCGFSKDFTKCIKSEKIIKSEANYTSNWNIHKQVKYILSPTFDNNNQVISIHTIFEDITEQVHARQALLDSDKTFRAIFNTAVDAIYIQDINGNFIDVNQGVINMYGYTKEELIGKSPEIIGAPDMNDIQMVMNCLNDAFNGEPQQFEFWGRKKNGDIFPKIVRVSSGYYFGKKVIFAFAVDNTEQKKSENKLRKQNEEYLKLNKEYEATNKYLIKAREKAEESERLKTAFLQNVSHEIRTPMNGILGFTSLLKTEHNTPEEQQSYVNMIMSSGKRMLNTIHDLMDIAKLETGQVDLVIVPTNINDELDSLYRFLKPETNSKGLELNYTTSIISNEANIHTDRKKITSILTNILKNAIKYTNMGSINFGYKLVYRNGNPKLEFFIKDTGIGIPTDRHLAIFERFIQADISDIKAYEGAGLGLSISKEYVNMLGGKIWVESVENEGSCFYFTIPFNQIKNKLKDKISNTDSIPNTPSKKINILIAEDELIADAFLTAALQNLADKILHVKTGQEAIEICKATPDIDLILMDIKMPAMNGYEATKQIRKFNKDIIIIAQTAFALASDRKKSIDAGCNDYISKPIDKDRLIEMIERLI